MRIDDGSGNGYSAAVDKNNKLLTHATVETIEHKVNHDKGRAYQLLFQQTATAGNDCILYMKNMNDDSIVLEGIKLRAAGNEIIELKINDSGIPSGGSDVSPVNCNAASGNIADGIFQIGDDITGLSGGDVVERIYVPNDNNTKICNFEMDIILPRNRVLTIYCVTGAIEVDGTLIFFYNNLTGSNV